MRFEWDAEKNRENQRMHRISFEDAAQAFQDPFPIRDYDDREYDEDRWVLIATMRQIIVYVVYTDRGDTRRLILARKAEPDEEARYWAGFPGSDEQVDQPFPGEMSDLPEGQTDWEYLLSMTDEEARRNALADEDSQPMTPEQLSRLRRAPNPRAIREQLKMTQEKFAREFQISVGTLRDWEQGLHLPDSAGTAYLRVIEQIPEAVIQALDASVPGRHDQVDLDIRPGSSVIATASARRQRTGA